MKKQDFLNKIHQARKQLEQELSGISPEMMELPVNDGNWSIKDTIAHIGWYEEQMVNLLHLKALKGSELWELDLEERNAAIHVLTRDDDLDDVLRNESRNYKTMMKLLQTLDEDSLNDSGAFSEMPSDWKPWSLIASNTYEHYLDHIQGIRSLSST